MLAARLHDVCMQGQGLGRFDDIWQLTMFADYRVPVVLRQMGILEFSPQLSQKVRCLPIGSF